MIDGSPVGCPSCYGSTRHYQTGWPCPTCAAKGWIVVTAEGSVQAGRTAETEPIPPIMSQSDDASKWVIG